MYMISESYAGRARAAFAKAREHYTAIMDGVAAVGCGMSLEEYRTYTARSKEETIAAWRSMSPVKKGALAAGALILIGAMTTCAVRAPDKQGQNLEQRVDVIP